MFRIHALSYFYTILFIVMLSLTGLNALQEHCLIWSFDKDNQAFFNALHNLLPPLLYVQALTYDINCDIDRKEIVELLGFDNEMHIARDQVLAGLFHMGYKEKFEKLIITITEDKGTWSFHISLQACWTLAKVRCKGPLFGKDRYRHMYKLLPGERFDTLQHHESLKAIEDCLREEGYLAPEVFDILDYDDLFKEVAVTLVLDPGLRYRVRLISLVLADDQQMYDKENLSSLLSKIKRMAVRELQSADAARDLIQIVASHIEELCMKEGFLQASVDYDTISRHAPADAHVIFKITLGERRKFNFFGNHFFSDKQLYERLLLFGKSISLVPATILVEELIDLYKDHGFWSIVITVQEEQDRCFFCIKEGSQSCIRGVRCEGVTYFSYADFCTFCSEMIRAPFFDKKKQRAVRANIIQAYVREGFWDCQIIHEEFIPRFHGSDEYEYHVVIREGLQRTLHSIDVKGFKSALEKDIFHAYRAGKDTMPFDIHAVQDQRRILLEYLHNNGYIYANPKPVMQQSNSGKVDVEWHVDDAYVVRFGSIVLAGTSRLRRDAIVRELTFKQGETWSQKKINRSIARLKALSIFDSVQISPASKEHETHRDVVVMCIDDDPFELRARAGVQCIGQYLQIHDVGIRYGGSLIWKNPTNRADHVKVALDVSPHIRYGEASYVVPWFFSYPIANTYSIYTSRFDEGLMACFKNRLYRLDQDGCSCEFEYDSDTTKVGICSGFESMKVTCLSQERAHLIDFSPQLINERVPYWYAESVGMVSRVDDAVNPTLGIISILSAKVMVPFRSCVSGFFKVFWEGAYFLPIRDWLIGALHVRAGHIFYTVFSSIMPSERFYLGGAYSLRGYDTDVAPPVTICGDRFTSTCVVPIGGKTILSAMCEARFPLYNALGGVIFTDFGILVRNHWKDDNCVGATGFGLRYATPVGALRFDIAWKWHHQEGEKHRFAWFLTLGQAF